MRNNITWFDILATDKNIREKLHLTDKEIKLTDEDIRLINTTSDVDMDELKCTLDYAGFANFDIPREIGISKAMYSMAFNDEAKNKRGLRMRTVVAMLNAIRNRGNNIPFTHILINK